MESLLGTARRGHPGLFWTGLGMAVLAVAFAAMALVDQRELLGAPIWFKPLKFAISIAIYALTLAWMLGRSSSPVLRRTGWGVAIGLIVEIAVIGGQAARGQMSHFNEAPGSGSLLWGLMGLAIAVVYLLTVVVAVHSLRDPALEPGLRSGVRAGLWLTLAGMSIGIPMAILGAHAIGVPDGGPGLPLVGWSTTGGDLRISHFVGLHALQLMPILAALLARHLPAPTARVRTVRVVGFGYLGLIALLLVQALRAQPLLAPDAVTLGLLSLLIVGTGLGVWQAARSREPQLV